MTKSDILKFIDYVEDYGDVEWTEERVADIYGDKSLQEAINIRMSEISMRDYIFAMAHLNQ